jgi:hypothetical protein
VSLNGIARQIEERGVPTPRAWQASQLARLRAMADARGKRKQSNVTMMEARLMTQERQART